MKPQTSMIIIFFTFALLSCVPGGYTKFGSTADNQARAERRAELNSDTTTTDPYSRHKNFGRTARGVEAPDQTATPAPAPVSKPTNQQERLLRKAKSLLGSPYRYGGGSPRGFDCSGFSQFVFSSVNVKLPRTSRTQARIGKIVSKRNARPGDLIFFANRKGVVNHVGIILSAENGELVMIHAGSKGVTTVDINRSNYWRPRFKSVRRVLQ